MTRNPKDIEHGKIQLKTKPCANLHYSFLPGDLHSNLLVVFLNGLILPQSSWEETILQTKLKTQKPGATRPHLLSYDRYGQGLSDKDPNVDHDMLDAVHDLHDFLVESSEKKLDFNLFSAPGQLIFVCNSIGCAIARLFATEYPGKVSGFLFLDSIMAHVDLVELWPNPDAPGFEESELPAGTTVDQLRSVRQSYRQRFHASVPNPEGLNRQTLSTLLPHADSPKLEGDPMVTVIGHDWDRFAEENEKSFGVPKVLVMKYVNPVWHEYNNNLATLTKSDKGRGPIIAEGCGHFIQKDNPVFVADEVCKLIQRLDLYARCS
ncbi:alpha/beta-hydrolase [Aureobasidium subglaciale]|nr:alpha/beta-hydrolase [Aureobasidium subglaciale]